MTSLHLWNNHPPYQIDGNFGYTAGIGEMLLGGSDGIIRVLPALPEEWGRGEFSGFVARGGVEFDCRWQDGRVTYLRARAKVDVTFELRLPEGNALDPHLKNPITLKAGECLTIIK